MIFENREHAGQILSQELAKLKLDPQKSIIAAVPRGGVVVGKVIAERLAIPLTAIVIKKLGAPANPELAIGATASHGVAVLDHWLIGDLGVSGDYLKREIRKKRREAQAREKFLGVKLSEDLFRDKDLVVVDDGLATGQTARAAAKTIRRFGPKRLILAVPCASPSTIEQVKEDYDEVICLETSPDLFAVGQFYRNFSPVEDREVKEILNSKN